MKLTDLINESGGSGICVSIKLDDLRQWHEEMLASVREQNHSVSNANAEEEFLSPAETCARLCVSRSTLTRWQGAGYLVPSKVGIQCRYKRSEIEAILNTKMK